jgi:glutathione S-transferase
MAARKKYDVKYPTMYDNSKPQFNAIQRGHQNMLETLPHVLFMTALGGAKHPLIATTCLCTWMIARVAYMQGYSQGAEKRNSTGGVLSYPSLIGLLGTTVSFSLTLLGFL